MITIKLKNFFIKFDFTFFAVLFLFMTFDTSGYGILSLYACLLHETGHLICMLLVKTKPTQLLFYCAGMKITAPKNYKLSFLSEFFVLIGGSGINFILFFVFYFSSDMLSLKLPTFAIINLLIGVFNLIPVNMFDGGKIIELILLKFVLPDTAYYINKILGLVFTTSTLISAIILYSLDIVNFTVVATLCYVCVTCLLTDRQKLL